MAFHGISWYFMVFHGISWYFMVFHGISSASAMDYHGSARLDGGGMIFPQRLLKQPGRQPLGAVALDC